MSNYPPVGETWLFDIGPAQIEHRYESDRLMHFHVISGDHAGERGSVAIEVQQVGAAQFLVSWQEANLITVVHWEDFAAQEFQAFATMPDLAFHRFAGKMRPL